MPRHQRRIGRIDAGWATREDEAFGSQPLNAFPRRIMRDQFAIYVVLAYPSCDELAVLRAKVDDRYGVPVDHRPCLAIFGRECRLGGRRLVLGNLGVGV